MSFSILLLLDILASFGSLSSVPLGRATLLIGGLALLNNLNQPKVRPDMDDTRSVFVER